MSTEAVKQFFQQAQHEPALRAKLGAIQPTEDPQEVIPLLVKVAADAGFVFTAQECASAIKAVMAQQPAPGELSEKQLEAVAGGSRRSQLFDILRSIIDKYNETAKGIIQSIGR